MILELNKNLKVTKYCIVMLRRDDAMQWLTFNCMDILGNLFEV